MPKAATLRLLLVTATLSAAGFGDLACSPPDRTASSLHDVADAQGVVENRRFFYTRQADVVAATFTPFIPRDDQAFIASARAVIAAAYKDDVRGDSARPVGGEVAFASKTAVYLVMPIKQDTGEIHSLRIRVTAR